MAVFLVNSCKFRGCGLTFGTLSELIQHIEDIHIDSDPRVLERQELLQPPSLPLSYVLRLYSDDGGGGGKPTSRPRPSSVSPSPSLNSMRSSTPTGSEFDEEDPQSDNENSDDSWTTQEEFTSELILSMMTNTKEQDTDKPFVCPVPRCNKRYKNVNGIKYHAKHGHKKEIRVKKPFRCKCGKTYKSASGLRHHSMIHHANGDFSPCIKKKLQQVTMASVPSSLLHGFQAVANMKGRPTQVSLGVTQANGTVQQLTIPVSQVVTRLVPANALVAMNTTSLATKNFHLSNNHVSTTVAMDTSLATTLAYTSSKPTVVTETVSRSGTFAKPAVTVSTPPTSTMTSTSYQIQDNLASGLVEGNGDVTGMSSAMSSLLETVMTSHTEMV